MMTSRSKNVENNYINVAGTYSSCFHYDHEKDYSSSENNLDTKFISKHNNVTNQNSKFNYVRPPQEYDQIDFEKNSS